MTSWWNKCRSTQIGLIDSKNCFVSGKEFWNGVQRMLARLQNFRVILGSKIKRWILYWTIKIINFNKRIICVAIICDNYVQWLDQTIFTIEYSYPNKLIIISREFLLYTEQFYFWCKFTVKTYVRCLLLQQEESIKILRRNSFQRTFIWKWKPDYFCNVKCLKSHFTSGFITTGYLLFGKKLFDDLYFS